MTSEFSQNTDALLQDTVRKDQIEYRKWIVTLATFVLTISLGLIGYLPKPLHYKWLLLVGWLLLGGCILFNWLIIKRLVSISLLAAAAREEPNFLHLFSTVSRLDVQLYAFIQNLAFLGGVLAVGLGFVLNI